MNIWSVHSLGVRERNHKCQPVGEEYVIAEVKFFFSSNSLVSSVNHMAARAFRGKKETKKIPESFFPLNFNVYINLDNRERARSEK